jgi:hypothetical protein
MSGEETREHCKRQERGDEHLTGGLDDGIGDGEQQPPPPTKKKGKYTFEDNFRALVAYKQNHGDCCTSLWREDSRLHCWVKDARLRKGGRVRLTDEQRDRLEGLGLGETKSEKEDRLWNEKFEKLKVYKQQHGDCSVPRQFQADPSLARWICSQRATYNNGTIHEGRKWQLESIGIVWKSYLKLRGKYETTGTEANWMLQYDKLVQFKQTCGHCFVPGRYKKDKSLGIWVSSQRARLVKDTIQQYQKDLLDKLGFDTAINLSIDMKWNGQFERLLKFKQEHGHCIVPDQYEKDVSLGAWVKNQRRRNIINTIRQDRKELLDKLGFTWKACRGSGLRGATKRTRQNEQDKKWVHQYEKLVKFKQKHGNCLVPLENKEVSLISLGAWVNTQRQRRHGRNEMRQDRKQLLDKLGFVWNATTAYGGCCFPAAAKKQMALSKHTHVESSFLAQPTFPTTVNRSSAKPAPTVERVRLPPNTKPAAVEFAPADQRARDDSTFKTGSQKPAEESPPSWDAMMKRLLHFKNEKGHPNVPTNFTKWGLGEWVETQRATGRNGELHWWQAERLIEVGLTWWREEE